MLRVVGFQVLSSSVVERWYETETINRTISSNTLSSNEV